MNVLRWTSAENDDEPGDQNADSALVDHGYWSLGPAFDGRWGVELIAQDADLEEVAARGVHLGYFASEMAAKSAADDYERMATPR